MVRGEPQGSPLVVAVALIPKLPPEFMIGAIMSISMTLYGIIVGYWATATWGPKGVIVSALSGLIVGTFLQVLVLRLLR